ncbi:MAG TPA: hypothetical protein VEQ62_06625 [Stellaceae bacterium]|nr:hypothetical protein [Stellaceae bacterium]
MLAFQARVTEPVVVLDTVRPVGGAGIAALLVSGVVAVAALG